MKIFLYKVLGISTILVLLLVCVNFYGDASHLFNQNYEKRIAQIMLQGKNVTNIDNFDERLLQKELIPGIEYTPDIVVLGSSRTMLIRNSSFSSTVFNNSVSGASIEDIIAIYQLYKANNRLPEAVIIGIDPWMFNRNNGQDRWKSISREYYSFLGDENPVNFNIEKYKQLISPSYFQISLKSLFNSLEPVSTSNKYNKTNTRLTDGSIVYGQKFRKIEPDQLDKRVNLYLQDGIYGLNNFNELSSDNINSFMKLLNDMKKNKIEIIFFLSPYHPKVYNRIKESYSEVLEVESFIKSFVKKNKINLMGSYDPSKLQMGAEYFYDGMHLNEKGVKKVLNDM